jgi:hypothetical protein
MSTDDGDERERTANDWYERKSQMLEVLLGKEHDMVMHAIIPYVMGGALDLYYYPNGIPGTGVATKELSDVPGEGSSNELYPNYELVMFTRREIDLDQTRDEASPFGKAHQNINAILNLIARYSAEAELKPRDTCEFPEDMEDVGGKCLIFDAYNVEHNAFEDFGVMLVMEVFRSEMEFARANGGEELLDRLKAFGHYPYSDMNREPVV